MQKIFTILLFFIATILYAQEKRIAIVIGNSNYSANTGYLPNPVNDANKIASALKECKFELFDNKIVQNASKKAMRDALTRFAQTAKNYDIGLIFYAGHGINVKGINYLVPTDFEVNSSLPAELNEANAPDDCISIDWIQNVLRTAGEYNKSYIIITDACRNNPYRSLKRDINPDTWVKPERVPSGFVTCFSASQGQKANDESPYTKALLNHIRTRGISIETLFKRVRVEVSKSGGQNPEESNMLTNDFYFVPAENNDDTDGDGIPNSIDDCPYVKGIKKCYGCPSCGTPPPPKDTDGDGFPDSSDSCPTEYSTTNNGCPVKEKNDIEMVLVKGGTFQMGDSEKHSVTVSDFYIGKYEVTQKQYQAIMNENPSKSNVGDDYPVETVSYNGAIAFITKLNAKTGKKYSLPTEAQWEYAARGGNKSNGYEFSGSNTIGDVAQYDGNNNKSTSTVGSKNANELDIFDMSGNVWEWCQDTWHSNYSGAPSDGSAWTDGSGSSRVYRGGSWFYDAAGCRVAFRYSGTPEGRYFHLGFRLVLPR